MPRRWVGLRKRGTARLQDARRASSVVGVEQSQVPTIGSRKTYPVHTGILAA